MSLNDRKLDTAKLKEWAQVHQHLLPGVIDLDMITHHVYEQGPSGEAGRIAKEEGLDFNEVTSLSLEYQRILKIDHLWVLPNLTKLQLNNNSIESIDNLHMLVHLRELDLSFNHIRVLENLEELVNLEILYLYQNHISCLENLDAQKKLCILSIGQNELPKREESILYLRRFSKLKSLNLLGNPMCETENFREYVLAFLPQLVYFEYAMVEEKEKATAQENFLHELTVLAREEEETVQEREAAEREAAEVELHSVAFVERLNGDQLFRSMFENDPDGQALVQLSEETREFYKTFREELTAVCNELFHVGQQQYILRKKEYDDFLSCVNETKSASQKESQSVLEAFLEDKKEVFEQVKEIVTGLAEAEGGYDEINRSELLAEAGLIVRNACSDFNHYLSTTWRTLMRHELTLSEQMEEVNTTLERDMSDMINDMLEQSLGFFVEMRTLQESFNEQLSEVSYQYQTMLSLSSDDSGAIPAHLLEIMADKESLSNALANSHEQHLMVIDAREDTLVTRIKDWHEDVCENLQKKEILRNREQVLEINNFLDLQREQFEELLSTRPDDLIIMIDTEADEGEGSRSDEGEGAESDHASHEASGSDTLSKSAAVAKDGESQGSSKVLSSPHLPSEEKESNQTEEKL